MLINLFTSAAGFERGGTDIVSKRKRDEVKPCWVGPPSFIHFLFLRKTIISANVARRRSILLEGARHKTWVMHSAWSERALAPSSS
jgi:hypothetical protein